MSEELPQSDQAAPAAEGSSATAGALWGLLFGGTWLLVEGAYLAYAEPMVPGWTLWLNPAAGAPAALFFGGLGALVTWAWGALPGRPLSSTRDRLWSWLREGSPETLSWRGAWILTGVILALAWFAGGVEAGRRIDAAIVTPAFQAALLILVQLASALVLAVLSPLVTLPLARCLSLVGPRLSHPVGVLLALVAVAVAGFGVAWALFGETLHHFPWGVALGPLLGVMVATKAVRLSGARAGRFSAICGAFVLLLALFGAYLPDSLRGARAVFVDQTSLASAWVGTIEPLMDADGDGASHLYGGGDCAPEDPAINPRAREIVGNGVDEDCWRGDLTFEPGALEMGPKHHPRPEGISETPHIVLVTIDALSFDHTNTGGYARDVTPNLEAWSSRSTVFEAAFSASSSTRLAMPAVVTGMFNSMVPMKNRRKHPYHYGDDVVTIAGLLKDKGYRTVHVLPDRYFDTPMWGGYWGGIQEIDRAYKRAADSVHTAPEVTDAAIRHIQSEDPRPLFLWVHYYDVHHPYKTPKSQPSLGTRKEDHYDAELRFLDGHLGRLLETIETRWDAKERVVFLTADHGEAFDKNHTKEHHDFSLHTAVLHIPLVIQGPWEAGRGKRLRGLTGQLDLLPTIASLVGGPHEELWQGESLIPSLVEGVEPEKKVLYSLFYIPEDAKRKMDGFRRFGVRTDDLYYFTTFKLNDQRLVRWRTDPLDDEDLMAEEEDAAVLLPYLTHTRVDWLREHERGLKRPWKRSARPPRRSPREPRPAATAPRTPTAPVAPTPTEAATSP